MNILQFKELLTEVESAYSKSDLKDKGLYYSLVGTQIKSNQPLIVGLNWGGGSKKKKVVYKPQTVDGYQECIDQQSHFMNTDDIGSLNRIKPYLEKYIKDISKVHIGWTNYCLFRTPDDSTLTNEAMRLTQPIFLKLIEVINPSVILCFSSQARDFLITKENFEVISSYEALDKNGKNKYNGIIGMLDNIKIYFLPHPEARISYIARDNAWQSCFNVCLPSKYS